MPLDVHEACIREVFRVSVAIKGLNALLEILVGGALIVTARFNSVLLGVVESELVEDPRDFLARHVEQFSPYLTAHAELYGGLYLLSHGVVKGIVVAGLLRNKTWAYPAGLVVFALFIAYQMFRWFDSHSLVLVALTAFDLFVMWLTWHEYRLVRAPR